MDGWKGGQDLSILSISSPACQTRLSTLGGKTEETLKNEDKLRGEGWHGRGEMLSGVGEGGMGRGRCAVSLFPVELL